MSDDEPPLLDDRRILDERARLLARPLAAASTATGAELLYFSVGAEELAIEVAAVREIVPLTEVTPVPDLAAPFLGVVNHGGEILPVIDVLALTGTATSAEAPRWLIVLGTRGPELGLAAGAVDRITPAHEAFDVVLASPILQGVTGGRRLVLRAAGILADPSLSE